jgi:hypothetical protein
MAQTVTMQVTQQVGAGGVSPSARFCGGLVTTDRESRCFARSCAVFSQPGSESDSRRPFLVLLVACPIAFAVRPSSLLSPSALARRLPCSPLAAIECTKIPLLEAGSGAMRCAICIRVAPASLLQHCSQLHRRTWRSASIKHYLVSLVKGTLFFFVTGQRTSYCQAASNFEFLLKTRISGLVNIYPTVRTFVWLFVQTQNSVIRCPRRAMQSGM